MVSMDNVDRINLLLNPGFEIPDAAGWDVDGGAGTLSATTDEEGADAGSGACLALAYELPEDVLGEPGSVSQALDPELAGHLIGRLLSLAFRVTCDTVGVIRPWISEDGGLTKQHGGANGQAFGHGWPGSPEETAATYETLKIEGVTLTGDASGIVCGVDVSGPCTGRLDNASLVFGGEAVAASGCIPAGVLKYLVENDIPTPVARKSAPKPEAKAEAKPAASARS